MFVEKCGSCHQLSRARTAGTIGPGEDAEDVAAYVAATAAVLGQDIGALAESAPG